jgi:hypothetical protein
MSNPTRDGRAMIAAGMLHPDGAPKTGAASPPHVTIGAVHVSNRPVGSRQAVYLGNERGVCLISHFGT